MKTRLIFLTLCFAAAIGIVALMEVRDAEKPHPTQTNGTNTSMGAPEVPSSSATAREELHTVTLIVPEEMRSAPFNRERTLHVPEGYGVSVFATGLGKARFFDFAADGTMYIADQNGRVLRLEDADENGVAESVTELDRGLQNPHSIEWHEGDLFVAEENRIVAYRGLTSSGTYLRKDVLIHSLPVGGGHVTRTIVAGPDGYLYVSVGSSCNVCEELDPRRAAISRFRADGTGWEIYAKGLRNSVGMAFKGTELWTVENGRDGLGDDVPGEEVNVIVRGGDYGWPYCHAARDVSPEFPHKSTFCSTTDLPRYLMQAHSAPLGMAFAAEEETLVIAFHGSWNRKEPTGYKLVAIDTSDPSAGAEDFVTGWRDANGNVWGRPVGVGFDAMGVLYVSDDKAGAVYRIAPIEDSGS